MEKERLIWITEFFTFDKFMFSLWKEKENISWGNALK